MQPEKHHHSRKKPANYYLKYAGLAFQMGGTITIFALIGQYLDERYQTAKPYWTMALALFGVCGSLYILFRQLLKKDQ